MVPSSPANEAATGKILHNAGVITDAERHKLRKRAKLFSTRRSDAIAWIDKTLLAIRNAKRISR